MLVRVEQTPRIIPSSSAPELMKDSKQEELDTITLSHMHPRQPEPAPAASVGSGRT
jgi:hypothetical protein